MANDETGNEGDASDDADDSRGPPGGAGDAFPRDAAEILRARYVIDRVDGRPLLRGGARCPYCEIRLRPAPQGMMEFAGDRVKITFHLACFACGRVLVVSEAFEPPEEIG